MGIFQRLFGGGAAPKNSAPSSQMHSQMHSQMPTSQPSGMSQFSASQNQTRRELLRVVLRETLHRQGIPPTWIVAETLNSTSRTGEKTIHWRLHVKHWDTRLMTHAVGLQHALIKRLMTFDPMTANWLSGISWQFSLEDESLCPALPHPGSWTADPQEKQAQAAAAQQAAGGAGDVIAGPVRIADTAPAQKEDARADLEQLFAIRDQDFRLNSAKTSTWERTEPAGLNPT